ncbi:MAG TPA: hypothetical protein VLL08_29975 [Kineosporiaceae bacterium]|nr:hypothetical protein [Kineosporiaceae bacterium]
MDVPADKAERKVFLEGLLRRAQQGDAEAAFQVGAHNVTGGTEAHYDAADRCFLKAIQFGGSAWAWRAADEYYYQDVTDRVRHWMARAIELDFPLPSAPGITVAPNTMEPVGDFSGITWGGAAFHIWSEDIEAVSVALSAAADRLILVDENGHEWPTSDALSDHLASPDAPFDRFGNPLSTPRYVSPPRPYKNGLYITLDTNSDMWGPMARTLVLVLIEELVSAGVSEARIGPGRAAMYGG